MSYDLYFFKLSGGETANTINAYLKSNKSTPNDEDEENDEIENEDIEDEDEDEDEDDEPLIPSRFIGDDLSDEQLRIALKRSLIRATVPENKRPAKMIRFLNSDSDFFNEGQQEQWEMQLDDTFDFVSVGGMVPVMFTYRNVSGIRQMISRMLRDLENHGIAVYDPQLEKAYDAKNLDEMLAEEQA